MKPKPKACTPQETGVETTIQMKMATWREDSSGIAAEVATAFDAMILVSLLKSSIWCRGDQINYSMGLVVYRRKLLVVAAARFLDLQKCAVT